MEEIKKLDHLYFYQFPHFLFMSAILASTFRDWEKMDGKWENTQIPHRRIQTRNLGILYWWSWISAKVCRINQVSKATKRSLL